MENIKNIEDFPSNKFFVLKIIQIQDNNPSWLIGQLLYLRDFTEIYSKDVNDELDIAILSGIQLLYPKSFLHISINIFFKEQLNERLRVLDGAEKRKIDIIFHPKIPSDLIRPLILSGRTFTLPEITFDLRILSIENQIRNPLNFQCHLPYDILYDIIKTIRPI